MKKGITIFIVILIIALIGFGVYYLLNEKTTDKVNTSEKESNNNLSSDSENNNKNILVVYYSAQNHTKEIANKIANNLNADIFEIEPKEKYTSDDLDWTNSNSRVSKEHDDESLRNVELKNTKVDNFDSYDTVLIGYPIWWGVAAWPVNNFVKDNDFTGKTVIPFCTSASSSLGNSAKLLEDLTKTGNWESGHRFSSSAADSDIKKWTDNLVK